MPPQIWWSWSGSNRRPPECKSGALPAELQPLVRAGVAGCMLLEIAVSHNPHPTTHNLSFLNRGRLDARPTGTRPDRQISRRTPSRDSEDGLDWKGCHLLTRLHTLGLFSVTPDTFSLRKEVIQPQVLLRLPCYDFTPIMSHTLGRCLPCGLARRLLVQPTFVM
jgi:hypothetical protein